MEQNTLNEIPTEVTQPIEVAPVIIQNEIPKKKGSKLPMVLALTSILVAGGVLLVYMYLNKGKESEDKNDNDVVTVKPTSQVTPTLDASNPDDFLNTLNWTLSFSSVNASFSRMGSGVTNQTFWQLPVVSTKTKNETVESIIENYQVSQFVFNTGKNEFYYLQPSGHVKLALVSKSEYEKLAAPSLVTVPFDKESGVWLINERAPFKLDFTSGSLTPWKAVKVEGFHVFEGTDQTKRENWLSNGYDIVCYIPLDGANEYIEVSSTGSAGSETNDCDNISQMGIQSVEKVAYSSASAVELVKKLPEVVDYIKRVPKGQILFDHEDAKSFVVHVFEVNVNNMTATLNWFEVNKQTGKITKTL